jgi:hypothetical protein
MPAMPSLTLKPTHKAKKERQTNKQFITAFEDFCSLCRGVLKSNTSHP